MSIGINDNRAGCKLNDSDRALVSGKIALISNFNEVSCRRFMPELLNDLDALGALGALVPGDRDRLGIIPLLETTNIELPHLMTTAAVATELQQTLASGQLLELSMYKKPLPYRDATISPSLLIHEWGHYLSFRLVGDVFGLINPQGLSMGEGWSDFLYMYFGIREQDRFIPGNERCQGIYSMGDYAVTDAYFGLRRIPYTTDMSLNGVTFENISVAVPFELDHPVNARPGNNAELHRAGEIWATALLEAYVALLNDHERLSFDEAKSRMAHYLVTGMKLTPVHPTFTQARDAVLAAAFANDKKDHFLMKKAFAKRGLGVRAVSPPAFSRDNIGVQNSFEYDLAAVQIEAVTNKVEVDFADLDSAVENDRFLSALRRVNEVFACDSDGILDNFEYGELSVSLRNVGDREISNLVLNINSDIGANLRFLNQGRVTVENLSINRNELATVRVPYFLLNAKPDQEIRYNIGFEESNRDVEYSESVSIVATVNQDPQDLPPLQCRSFAFSDVRSPLGF